jgi:hypothetical protein
MPQAGRSLKTETPLRDIKGLQSLYF